LSGIIALAVIGVVVIVGPNLDQLLIQTPVVGYLYERFFRKITLYRLDLTSMYLTSVHRAVTKVLDELTKAQGIPPLSELERRPVMRELFHRQRRRIGHRVIATHPACRRKAGLMGQLP
jgi:hypothetical protein